MARLLTFLLAAFFRALCSHGLDSALEPYALAMFPNLAPGLVILATLLICVLLIEAAALAVERFWRR